ncbi:MAG TPA: bifunctional adenosylcobinamide kinase/adenosylcobinamide-phosphate guanylyltransferase [Steroidobacteraceae bacterium]|jgi:adenosylcobinamide kinase/adenosylcobinamide-phosphate guanylyltransferase|nr:bifunctional adenosylcobinamide kinase/adenosylcobinamide-phosphate guanylyltransferase [Steroidobacteraceae bacterium]
MKALVLGGVRSGKSRYAAELAREQACPVTLIVTGSALDEEMAARIDAHRATRPPAWRVVEEPAHLAAALSAAAAPNRMLIVDCLTLWLTNLLCSEDPQALRRESRSVVETLPTLPGHCVLVANEVSLGVIPANALARRFTDEAGVMHQELAAICDRVVFMVAGLPMTLKAGAS